MEKVIVFQCGVCKQIKKTSRGLQLHITRYCGKKKPLICVYCNVSFPNEKQLRSHIYKCPTFAASCYSDGSNPFATECRKMLDENKYGDAEVGLDISHECEVDVEAHCKLVAIRCPRSDPACLKYYKLIKKLEQIRAKDALNSENFTLQKDILHFMTITELW